MLKKKYFKLNNVLVRRLQSEIRYRAVLVIGPWKLLWPDNETPVYLLNGGACFSLFFPWVDRNQTAPILYQSQHLAILNL